jgi:nicotinate-nucleotide adenylyltransferase
MVDTLGELSRLGDLFLIVGADQLAVFDRWHESDAIRRLATLVVAPRSPQTIAGDGIVVLQMPPVDLSSTGVRAQLAAGRAAAGLAPPVQQLIDRERLYDNAPC